MISKQEFFFFLKQYDISLSSESNQKTNELLIGKYDYAQNSKG